MQQIVQINQQNHTFKKIMSLYIFTLNIKIISIFSQQNLRRQVPHPPPPPLRSSVVSLIPLWTRTQLEYQTVHIMLLSWFSHGVLQTVQGPGPIRRLLPPQI